MEPKTLSGLRQKPKGATPLQFLVQSDIDDIRGLFLSFFGLDLASLIKSLATAAC